MDWCTVKFTQFASSVECYYHVLYGVLQGAGFHWVFSFFLCFINTPPTPRHYSAHDVVLASAIPTQVSGINTIRWSDGHSPSVYSHTCQSSVYAWGRSEGRKTCRINNLPKVGWALKSGLVQHQNLSEWRMEVFFFFFPRVRAWRDMSHSINDKNMQIFCTVKGKNRQRRNANCQQA